MVLSIISIVSDMVSVISLIVIFIVWHKRIDNIELVLGRHATKIYEMRRTIKRLEQEISDLEMRLDKLDNEATNDSSGGTGKSN